MKQTSATGSAHPACFHNSVNPMSASITTPAVCTPMMAPRQPSRRRTSVTIRPKKNTST